MTMTNSSPTQFMWPVIKNYTAAPSFQFCWLCGGACDTHAMPLRCAIPDTFCLPEQAQQPNSDVVCYPCAALASKETFDAYAAERPEMGLKPGYATSWRNYSHVVFANQHYCPDRASWRAWLLEPPTPPFLFVMAVSSQKHLIYKSRVSGSREQYFVQMEDDLITVNRSDFHDCLAAFENLYNAGFSKIQIETANYNQKTIFQAGMVKWRELDQAIQLFRDQHPLLIQLASFVAQKEN